MLRMTDGGQLPFDTLDRRGRCVVGAAGPLVRRSRAAGKRAWLQHHPSRARYPAAGRGDLRGAQIRRHAAGHGPSDRRCRRVRWTRSAAQLRSLRRPVVAGGPLPSRSASRWRHAMDGSSADDAGLLARHRSFAATARRVLRLRAWPYRPYARTDDWPSDRRSGRGPAVPARSLAVCNRTVQLRECQQ